MLEKQNQSLTAALRGLDFFVRNQISDNGSADEGRFPYVYDCSKNKIITMTTN